MLTPGTLLQERYRIHHQLGHGGMGYVYIATDESIASTVAIKERQADANSDKLHRAFEREAQLLANLRHPALPRVMHHFVEGDGQFLVMEYIEGSNLLEWLETHRLIVPGERALPYELVINWADALLNALEYLHGREIPIIHRDIKPTNIKVNNQGEVFLLDFGLAKGTVGGHETSTVYGLTTTYAPLEQFLNTGTDARSDIYSLGATLYHLLSGTPPVTAADRHRAFDEGEADPLPPAHEVNAAVPEAISRVIGQAMALSRKDRISSAAKMRAALHAAQQTIRDEELRRQKEEEERRRREAEEATRRAAEEKRRQEEEQARELERQRAAEEARRKQEEEAHRRASEQANAAAASPSPTMKEEHLPQSRPPTAAPPRQPFSAAPFRDSADGIYLSEVMKHTEAGEQQEPPQYKLFSPRQVGAATFFGSTIAGGWLLASNYAKLNQAGKARWTLILSIAGLLLILILAGLISLNDSRPGSTGGGSWLGIIIAYGFYYLAKRSQGANFIEHLELGGAKASNWLVAGISLTAIMILLLLSLLIISVIGYAQALDQSPAANQLVVEANKQIADANRYNEQYGRSERDLMQATSDQDNERVKRLAQAEIYSLTQSAQLWREAAEKYEQVRQMRVNANFKQYILLRTEAIRKLAAKADLLAERAEILYRSDLSPEQITDRRASLLERAKQLDTQAAELLKQAETLAQRHPTDFGAPP